MSPPFLYDLHVHTREVSACSRIGAEELVRHYRALGYAGIAVTDHFFSGSTTVPDTLPWPERVRRSFVGYEMAKGEGDRLGFSVFPAWEFTIRGADFLTYGLGPDWLLSHEGMGSWGPAQYADRVHAAGGFLVHAHPFREASYIECIQLLPRKVDAVEVFNACRRDAENRMAAHYAHSYGLPGFSGSDNHGGDLKRYGAMATAERVSTLDELIRVMARGEAKPLRMSEGVREEYEGETGAWVSAEMGPGRSGHTQAREGETIR